MLSFTRAIIYLQGVQGFRSRPAPGSGSETLVLTQHPIYSNFFLQHFSQNNQSKQNCLNSNIYYTILLKHTQHIFVFITQSVYKKCTPLQKALDKKGKH